MNNKKIWLFFIPLFISLFVFGRPVKAEENNSLDSAVSLSLNQTLTRSVDKNVVLPPIEAPLLIRGPISS